MLDHSKVIRDAVKRDPSHPVVLALRGYILAKIQEYQESRERATNAIYAAAGRDDPDSVRTALADFEGAQHCSLELEELAALLFLESQPGNEP